MVQRRRTTNLWRVFGTACVLAALAAAAGAESPGASERPEPRRLRAEALGRALSIEIRDLPIEEADDALRDAFHHLRATVELLDQAEERLNVDARMAREVALEPTVFELLERALGFCLWSDGAVGPLGGSLRDHWRAAAGNPTPPLVSPALAASASCDRMRLDREERTVRLAGGSRVSFAPFAAGYAVDRTVERMIELGAGNGRVQLGRIERVFGPGPQAVDEWGDPLPPGWPVVLPTFEGEREPLDRLRLADGSVAVLWRADWPADRPLHVDQRTGAPPGSVWATMAVTELAVDAQALAVAGMVLGTREGRFRMAGLKPEPAVLWLMGSGRGQALRADLNWSTLDTF